MQEFVYFNDKGLDFPLPEHIYITSKMSDNLNNDFIVSNSKSVHGEVIADEIDFYITNSQDSIADKIKNIEKLYEINAVRFDMAQDIVYTQDISNQVLLICTEEQKIEFVKTMVPDEFDLYYVNPNRVNQITGHIGELHVSVNNNDKDVILNVAQIVWYDQDDIAIKQSGSFDPNETSLDEVLSTLRLNISQYEYKKFTVYDQNICQYHERREETCGRCVDVCPTVAIVKDNELKHLEFSQIDCHGCGGCVSVCPSGAIDYAPSKKETIFEMAKYLNSHIPLIIPSKMDIKNLQVNLKEGVLPFAIEGEKFLHEGTFLTILQESGSQVVFYTDFLSKGSKDAIFILNQIYQKKYAMDAILLAMNKEELVEALDKASLIKGSRYTFNEDNTKKREIFALRLRNIVGDEDLDQVQTGENIRYAKVKVNESKCTLCLSCVGACNVDALVANIDDNSLRINPSICTACGYCEVSCPESDCLSIDNGIIELNPTWFQEQLLAKDTLFACVECGVEFATTKAIEKIANMMKPIFGDDLVKIRTLYCCASCKPKIMMNEFRKNPEQYNNKQGIV
ncbi:MAG: 4Fe-4S ferredoxin [Sulfurimonas sp.]|nr:MAG: 4Fe-4S ferredoxin [Sulfurimonas sp.]